MSLRVCPVIEVSPQQRCAGLAIAAVGGRRLVLTVLPKVWRPADRPTAVGQLGPLSAGRTAELTMFEGDSFRMAVQDADVALALVGVCATAGQNAKPAAAASPLLGLDVTVDGPILPVVPVLPAELAHHSLLGLALLAGRLDRASDRPSVQRTTGGFDLASAAGLARDDHQVAHLIRAWALVRALARRIRQTRRDYTQVEGRLGAIRGRVSSAGMLRHAATGAINLDCVFDEFSEATPLLQVVATTLECLAAGEAARGLLRNCSVAHQVTHVASGLRSYLAGIAPVSRPTAVHLATTIRLPFALHAWSDILRQSRAILLRAPPGPEQGQAGDTGAFAWSVDTAEIWEGLLEDSLQSVLSRDDLMATQAGSASETLGMRCPSPWAGIGQTRKRPDLQLRRGSDRWVIDAKYKLPNSAGLQGLGMDDQYQLYAYSLLAHDARCTHAAVVRPRLANVSGWKPTSRVLRTAPGGVPPLELHDIRLPFPSPAASTDDHQWAEALAAMRVAWVEQLAMPTREGPTP